MPEFSDARDLRRRLMHDEDCDFSISTREENVRCIWSLNCQPLYPHSPNPL
jgi:hypothetical protein